LATRERERKRKHGRFWNDSRSHFISEGDAGSGTYASMFILSVSFFINSLLIDVGEKQVNEEIEANIEITREIESSIVKCEEIEADLATREADLIKTSAMLQFDAVGYVTVAGISSTLMTSVRSSSLHFVHSVSYITCIAVLDVCSHRLIPEFLETTK